METTLIYRQNLEKSILQSDVIKIFDNLLTIAVEENASDIHIEPFSSFCRIRMRKDGILQELLQYPKTLHETLIAKFKIESGQMRPDERRFPQDARVSSMSLTNKEIDLRANTLPTIWGEKLVLRIVDKSKSTPKLEELGVEGTMFTLLNNNIHTPHGIILATGPTGSGKTTTLYACLQQLNKDNVNIITYEDPVESPISGLNQSQIRADIGYTFAQGLRGSLRQDPDIMMVGEIRDKETLEIAMEASMTGHLVLSTIHTNSAIETITRIINLGGQPFMIAGTFTLVISQRLLRKLCPDCKIQKQGDPNSSLHYRNAKELLASMDKELLKKEIITRGITNDQRSAFVNEGKHYLPSGHHPQTGAVCETCQGSGYKQRMGVFEIMEYNDIIKQAILEGKSTYEIEKIALSQGLINIEKDGIFKAIKGLITLQDLYSIINHHS